MSVWAHVAGMIRVDGFFLTEETRAKGLQDLKDILGPITEYKTPQGPGVWNDSKIPCGSEGSLQYDILVSPNLNHAAQFVVAVWGDLRSFVNEKKQIESWWESVLDSIENHPSKFLSVRLDTLHVYDLEEQLIEDTKDNCSVIKDGGSCETCIEKCCVKK